ncbi:MAG: zinc-dependent alcohol dehydrogenase family protein, partial [Bryobacteraceae bacterium]
MKSYEVKRFGIENLRLVDVAVPQPAAGEVLVKFGAASLNYRDLLFIKGEYNPKARLPAIPLSDAAGEVASVGAEVTKWKTGDRVCPILMQGWLDGPLSPEKRRTALGAGDLPGVLREYGVFNENGLVKIPEHLSPVQGATLPCAAVTVWNALVESGGLRQGETVLTLGTGGVSLFALQLAKSFGARVFITSSSDQKLRRAEQLGADEVINYKSTPEW